MSNIHIVPYDRAWPGLFAVEKAHILQAISTGIDDIEHVGSTSIPGLDAKPIIDLLIGLPDISLVEQCVEPLKSLGYAYFGESGIPERHFFRKPDREAWTERTHQIHMVRTGNAEWCKMLLFRNYLRDHPPLVLEYAQLKRSLSEKYAYDPNFRHLYPDGKSEFVQSVLLRASREGYLV